MKRKDALEEFKRHLAQSAVGEVARTPREGSAGLLEFYANVRVADVDLDADGDMLLFQWGTYDWGDGPMFEFDVTRQLIGSGGEDDDIWQLHVTYRFAPSEALRSLGKGNRWCARPDQLAEFRRFIENHAATDAVGTRDDGQIHIEYECAG
jgi:hypothetical protein